jgi:four helix bundle protein
MDSIVEKKSFEFAIRIVNLYKFLIGNKKEYVLSKQLIRSGTSLGANIAEALQAQSRADFIAKMNISLKEAAETKYWLRLLAATEYLTDSEINSILNECIELEKMLYNIVRSSKNNIIQEKLKN